MKDPYLSVIIPVFNEEKKIAQDCSLWAGYLTEKGYDHEIIVVNDGSTDATRDVLDDLERQDPDIFTIQYHPNRGKGYAVRKGVEASKGRYVVVADAGQCVHPFEVEKGLRFLREGKDVALASRLIANAKRVGGQPRWRTVVASVFRWMAVTIMGVRAVRDTQCGLKMFQGPIAREIFSHNRINGFMLDIETVLRAQKMGCLIAVFPVVWTNDPDSRFSFWKNGAQNLRELFLIKIKN